MKKMTEGVKPFDGTLIYTSTNNEKQLA